jgi:hypothetical protein
MELLRLCLSKLGMKHFRLGLADCSIIVQADFGPFCADANCNGRLMLGLYLGPMSANSIPLLHCSVSGWITGMIESFGAVQGWTTEEKYAHFVNSFSTVSRESLPSGDDIGATDPNVFPL